MTDTRVYVLIAHGHLFGSNLDHVTTRSVKFVDDYRAQADVLPIVGPYVVKTTAPRLSLPTTLTRGLSEVFPERRTKPHNARTPAIVALALRAPQNPRIGLHVLCVISGRHMPEPAAHHPFYHAGTARKDIVQSCPLILISLKR